MREETNPTNDRSVDNEEPGSIFAAVLDLIPISGSAVWNLRSGLEAVLITLVSVYVVQGINVPESGMVGLALASAAMVPRFNVILATNRERIWSRKSTGNKANIQSALSGMSVFAGMFIGFLIIAAVSDYATLKESFGFILRETGIEPGEVLSPERFTQGYTVTGHNLFILGAFGILSLLYRSLGTMIALGWNASVWAITLVLFIKSGSGGDTSQLLYALIVIVAVLPHLVVEAFGYVVGALCGVFLSRGVTIYEYSDPRLRRVLKAVVILALVSVLLIVVGGLIESNYAPLILRFV
jgi:hypothetical protein